MRRFFGSNIVMQSVASPSSDFTFPNELRGSSPGRIDKSFHGNSHELAEQQIPSELVAITNLATSPIFIDR